MASPSSGDADDAVRALIRFVSSGEYGLTKVPPLIKEVIRGDYWRHRSKPFTHFEQFITHPPMDGLGADVGTVRRLCSQDKDALNLLDEVLGRNQGERTDLFDDVQEVRERAPTGNSTAAALRRLKKDRPDLHARVLAGKTSAHRAMVEAGFRPPTAKIRLDDMAAAAATLRAALSAPQLGRLVTLLGEAE